MRALRCRLRTMAHCRGLTVVEMMLALGVLSSMGVVVWSMMAVVADTHHDHQHRQNLVVKQHMAEAVLHHWIGQADRVLARDEDVLVLWVDRPPGAGAQPRRDQIVRIEWHEPEHELRVYHAPDDLDSAQNPALELDSDFEQLTAGWRGEGYFPRQWWLSGVEGCRFAFADEPDPEDTRLIGYAIELSRHATRLSHRSAAALRDPSLGGTYPAPGIAAGPPSPADPPQEEPDDDQQDDEQDPGPPGSPGSPGPPGNGPPGDGPPGHAGP